MAKNRLIKSSKGNGYGILDEETGVVTSISPETNKLIESKHGNGFGILFGDTVIPVDTTGIGKDIDLFKKKDDTALSGETSFSDSSFNPLSNDKFSINNPSQMGRATQSTEEIKKEEAPADTYQSYTPLTYASLSHLGAPAEKAEISKVDRAKRDYLDDIVKSDAWLPAVPGMNNTALGGGMMKLLSGAATAVAAMTEFTSNFIKGEIADPNDPVGKTSEGVAGSVYDFASNLSKIGDAYIRNSSRSLGVDEKNVGRGITELLAEGQISDAFKTLGVQAFSQVPQVMLLAATGGGAGAVFASSAALGTIGALQEEYDKDGDITAGNVIKSLGKGIVEGVTETVFRGDIVAGNKLGKGLFSLSNDPLQSELKYLIKKEGRDAVKELIIRDAGQVFKKALGGAREEGIEEVLASVGDFIIDRLEDGKWADADYKKLLRDTSDSFWIGAATGGVLSGAAARASMKPLDKDQKRSIEKYQELANDENQPKEVRDIATKQIDDIVKYNADKTYKNYTAISMLPIKQRVEALKIKNSVDELEEAKSTAKSVEFDAIVDRQKAEGQAMLDKMFDNHYQTLATQRAEERKSVGEKTLDEATTFLQANNTDNAVGGAMGVISTNLQDNKPIDVNEMNDAIDKLYEIANGIDAHESLSDPAKNLILGDIYDKIDKLEKYEFTTKTETTTATQEVTTKGVKRVGSVERKNARQTAITSDRFNGEQITFTNKDGVRVNGVASVDKNGRVTVSHRNAFNLGDTEKEKQEIPFDSNFLEFKESIFDDDGNVSSVVLSDNRNGNTFEINNPELALDLAIKAKQDKLGAIEDAVFEPVLSSVKSAGKQTTTTTFINQPVVGEQKAPTGESVTPETEPVEVVSPQNESTSFIVTPEVTDRRAPIAKKKKGSKERRTTVLLDTITDGVKTILKKLNDTLKSIDPNADIVIYATEADMINGLIASGLSRQQALAEARTANGLFTREEDGKVKIHVLSAIFDDKLVPSKEGRTVIPHEIGHVALVKLAQNNPAEFKIMKDRLKKALPKSISDELNSFEKNGYDVNPEEWLAQLGALLTTRQAEFEKNTMRAIARGIALTIKDFIKSIATKLNNESLNSFADSLFREQSEVQDVVNFFAKFADSVRNGRAVDMSYINNKAGGYVATTQEGTEVKNQKKASAIEEELRKVQRITSEQAKTLTQVIEQVVKNISKRLGISVDEYSNRLSIVTSANNLKKQVESSLESIRLTGDNIEVLYQSEANENYVIPQKYLKSVKGLLETDFWLSKLMEFYDQGDRTKLHTLGTRDAVINEVNKRLNDRAEFIKDNISDYTIKSYTDSFIDSRIKKATDENMVDDVTHWTLIKNDASYRDKAIAERQEIQKASLLSNISYIQSNTDYDAEFRLLSLEDMLANRYALNNKSEIERQKVKPSDYKTTESPIIKLNPGALSRVFHNHGNSGGLSIGAAHLFEIQNAPKVILESTKFNKYVHKETSEGVWLKFPKGDDPFVANDLYEIASTSYKYPAQWCTGGSQGTALSQLRNGDFYVFVDAKSGDARVAVRYEGDKIGELRGLGSSQSLLPEDSNIINDVVTTFPNGDKYKKYRDVQKNLIGIRNGEIKLDDLSESELIDILTVKDSSHDNSDELLISVKSKIKSDTFVRFGYKAGEVYIARPRETFDYSDLNYARYKLFIGNLYLASLTSAKGLTLPTTVTGDLYLRSLTSAEGLTFPTTVNGDLYLTSLTSAKGLTLPTTVTGDLYLRSLTSAEGLTFPTTVNGDLYLDSLTSAEGLTLPTTVNGRLDLGRLTSAEGLTLPTTVNGSLYLMSLTSAEGLTFPTTVNGDLYLDSLTSAEGLTLPTTVNGRLDLGRLTSAEGLTLPTTVNGVLNLKSLTSAEGLTLPTTVNGRLDLRSLTSAEGLTLPTTVNGRLDLGRLTSAEGLTFPTTVNGSLYLNNLTSAEGLTFPTTVNGNLHLSNLTSAEGLTFPTTVKGRLDLGSLTSAEGLTLPTTVNGDLDLISLTSAEGLTLPTTVNGYLYLNNLTSAEGLTLPATVNGGLDLRRLTSAEGLTFPTTVKGYLYLNNLTSAEGLTLPTTVNGDLYLGSLTSAEGLTLPTTVNGELYLNPLMLNSLDGLTIIRGTKIFGSELNSIEDVTSHTAFNKKDASGVKFIDVLNQTNDRGVIIKTNDRTRVILSKQNADVTSPIHEMAHEYERVLTSNETKTLEEWSGEKKGTKAFSEAFAVGAEKYIYEGSAGNSTINDIFKRLKDWFQSAIKDSIIYFKGINELNSEVRDIYSAMLLADNQSQQGGTIVKSQKKGSGKTFDLVYSANEAITEQDKKSWSKAGNWMISKWMERMGKIETAFKDAEMEFALYTLFLKAGATPFATREFSEKYAKIFNGLNKQDKLALDSVVLARRVIAIDSNFDSRGVKRPLHQQFNDPNNKNIKIIANKESAQVLLDKLETIVGKDKARDINDKATQYFEAFSDILDMKLNAGIIDAKSYNMYKNYEYSPRQFLEHFMPEDVSYSSYSEKGTLIKAKEFKNIRDGSEGFMITDTERLLKAAMIAAHKQVLTNRALSYMYDEGIGQGLPWIKELNYHIYKDGTIKLNLDGSPATYGADSGFEKMMFKRNGRKVEFQLKQGLANEFHDRGVLDNSSIGVRAAGFLSGAWLTQLNSVGINPSFGLFTNPSIDLSSQVFVTTIWDHKGNVGNQSISALKHFLSISGKLIKKGTKLGDNSEIKKLIIEYGRAGGFQTTITDDVNILGGFGSALGYAGNITEIASKLGAYKATKDNLIKDYVTKNGSEPEGEDMNKIEIKASFISRSSMDFHRGGTYSKIANKVIPFFNVGMQVKKITVQYIRNNPVSFLKKVSQGIQYMIGLTLYNLLIGADDYEKDPDLQRAKLNKVIIMYPFKSGESSRGYLAMPVGTSVKAFLNIGQVIGEALYYKLTGKAEPKEDTTLKRHMQGMITMFGRDALAITPVIGIPTVRATISGYANFDFYNFKPLSYDKLRNVYPAAEGAANDKILSSLKLFANVLDKISDPEGVGKGAGYVSISPERLQKSLEMVWTSPAYSPAVLTAYSLIDNLVGAMAKETLAEKKIKGSIYIKDGLGNLIPDLLGNGSSRMFKSTNPENYNKADYDKVSEIESALDIENKRNNTVRREISSDISSMITEATKRKATGSEMAKEVSAYTDKIKNEKDYKYANNIAEMNYKKSTLSFPSNIPYYEVIKYGTSDHELRAKFIYSTFGDISDNPDLKNDLGQIGFGKDDAKAYGELLRSKGIQ